MQTDLKTASCAESAWGRGDVLCRALSTSTLRARGDAREECCSRRRVGHLGEQQAAPVQEGDACSL